MRPAWPIRQPVRVPSGHPALVERPPDQHAGDDQQGRPLGSPKVMAGKRLPALLSSTLATDARSMFGKHSAQEGSGDTFSRKRLAFADPSVPARACCCPARPVARVSMPPVPGRPYSVDLWLCGHHYRTSWVTLDAVGATVDFVGEWDEHLAEPAATAAR